MKLTDFVIGLGFDDSDFQRGMKSAGSSLDGFRASAIQVGATLLSAFSFKGLTFDFAEQNLQLAQTAKALGVTTDALYGFNQAGKSFGATEGEMLGALQRLTANRDQFLTFGKTGIFEDLALNGLDFAPIAYAKDNMEAMLRLAEQFSKLDARRQRNVAELLGLTPAQIALFGRGRAGVEEMMRIYKDARPHTEAMSKASAELTEQWNLLKETVGGRLDTLARPLTEDLTEITASTRKWIDANQALIDQNIAEYYDRITENIVPISTALALAVGPIGAMAGAATGFRRVLFLATRLFTVVAAIGAAVELWDWDAKKLGDKIGVDPKKLEWLFKTPSEVLLNALKDDSGQPYDESDVYGAGFAEEMRPVIGPQGLSASAIAVDSKPIVVNSNVRTTIELDGEKVSESVTRHQNRAIRNAQETIKSTVLK